MMSNQRPLSKHPASMENYDQGALNDLQQTKTNQKKVFKLNLILPTYTCKVLFTFFFVAIQT